MRRLRDTMREDLVLRGMSANTIETYVGCARRFAERRPTAATPGRRTSHLRNANFPIARAARERLPAAAHRPRPRVDYGTAHRPRATDDALGAPPESTVYANLFCRTAPLELRSDLGT